MAPKIPPMGDVRGVNPADPAAAAVYVTSRISYAFLQLGRSIEDSVEKALDMVLGPATEDGVRSVTQEPLSKRKRKMKKRKQRDERRRREAEEDRRRLYETEVKSQKLAEAVRAQEKAKEAYEKELQESEEGNRALILQFTLVQVGGLYAVSQACLLSIFVPQKCPAIPANYTSPWFTYNTVEPDGHLCTMKENLDWYNDTIFNQSVIVVNLLTLALMLCAQSYFWKREVWFVEHLEEDNSIPYDSLPKELKGYEEFEEMVKGFNFGAYAYASVLAVMIIANLSLSTYFLVEGDGVYNYNIGSRTYTGLITNTMLVSTKIIGFWSYARLSYTHDWAISMFTVIPLSYNRVDHEYQGKVWLTELEMQAQIDKMEIPDTPAEWGVHAEPEDDML